MRTGKIGKAEFALLVGVPFVSVLVWTESTLDPVNLPKMVALVTIAFACLPWLFTQFMRVPKNMKSFFILAQGFSILWIIAVAAKSSTNALDSFFGVAGRYNGAITYISFLLIAASVSLIRNERTQIGLLLGLMIAGVVNLIYNSIVIVTKSDPIPWVNRYGNILGTFGNPNFISSFLGIFNIVLLCFFLKPKIESRKRLALLLFFLVSLFQIIDSQSLQGLIVTAIGCGGVIVYRINCLAIKPHFKVLGLLVYLFSGLIAVLGMLQIGPLSSVLYKASVSIRGAYWRAGWETMLQNPILGIGPDSFGDWYTRVRDSRALVLPGPDVFTNSPHNVFIEQGVNGGVLLFSIYLVTQMYILACGLRYLIKNNEFNYVFAGAFFGWIGFTSQSLISINQIGLAVWGYVLGAIVVGYYLSSRDDQTISKPGSGKKIFVESEFTNLLIAGGAAVGLALSLPPFYADAKWRSALESKNLEKVIAAGNQWPQSTDRYIQVSKALYENRFYPEALEFVRKGIDFNPINSRLWYFLYQLPGSTQEEKDLAVKNLSILDPNFKVK